jgi:prepilin-type processing-associated H-X9-DG protein
MAATNYFYNANATYTPAWLFHNKSCNFLFKDGHVKSVKYGVSFNTNWQLQ